MKQNVNEHFTSSFLPSASELVENHAFRFNIWNTGSDLNFDRIAHLAKLVFNTRGVYINMVEGQET